MRDYSENLSAPAPWTDAFRTSGDARSRASRYRSLDWWERSSVPTDEILTLAGGRQVRLETYFKKGRERGLDGYLRATGPMVGQRQPRGLDAEFP